jgi:hypothetical protein
MIGVDGCEGKKELAHVGASPAAFLISRPGVDPDAQHRLAGRCWPRFAVQ